MTEEPEDIEELEGEDEEDQSKLATFYLDQLKLSKKQHEKFYSRGEKAIKAYLAEYPGDDQETNDVRRLNIWNSIVSTMLPAYYARTPKVEVTLRKKLGQAIDSMGARAIEYGTQYCLEECQDFDAVAMEAVKSFLLPGRGITWERYEAKTEMVTEEIPVMAGPDGQYMYSDGAPLSGEEEIAMTDIGPVASVTYEKLISEKSITDFVHYKDYLQSPARFEAEVDWKARRVYLSKEEFKTRFEEFDYSDLQFDTVPEELDELSRGKEESKRLHGKTAIWEIWVKSKNKVLWVSEDYSEGLIEMTDPPVKLTGFFPCPPAICANYSQDSAVPTSDYHIVADLIKEVERLTTRMHACTEAIRVNGAYDKALGGLLNDMFSTDFEMIPIDDYQTFATKGSLDQRMFFSPVEPYANVLGVLSQARDNALQKVYEVTGSSDIIRGATSPDETAAAQQLKGNFAQLRFSLRQRQIQKFIAAIVKIKAEVICQQFSDETLYEICRGQELEANIPIDPQTGQPSGSFAEVIAYIRDPYKLYKIDIETDSMIALDEAAEREQRSTFLNSIGQFMQHILQSMQQYPSLAPMFMEMVAFAVRSYRAGKELEGVIERQLTQFAQEVSQQAEKAKQEPQDPKIMDVQAKLQIAQIEAQSDMQQTQAEMYKTNVEAELKKMEMHAKAQELALKQQQMQLEAGKTMVDVKNEAEKQNLEMRIMELTNKLEALRVQYEIMEKIPTAMQQAPAPQGESKGPIEISLNMPTGKKVIKWVDGGAVVMPVE